MAAESRTAVAAALLGNLALAVLKGIAALVTGSAAMLAETFHSVADCGNQVLLFVGMRLAERPPDERHRFGHGKNVYFWAFVVSGLLFSVGGGFAIWEAVRTFLHPHPHESFAWAWGVLVGSLVFESLSISVALRALLRDKGNEPLRDYLRDVRDPTVLTVVCEDAAALASILIAAAGIALTELTGAAIWDGIASGSIGVLLIGVAVFLAMENYSLLLGETAPPDVERRIREAVTRDPALAALVALYTMHLGPTSLLVALEVHFRPGPAPLDAT